MNEDNVRLEAPEAVYLTLHGVPVKGRQPGGGQYFHYDPQGVREINSGNLLHEIDAACAQVHERLAGRIFRVSTSIYFDEIDGRIGVGDVASSRKPSSAPMTKISRANIAKPDSLFKRTKECLDDDAGGSVTATG